MHCCSIRVFALWIHLFFDEASISESLFKQLVGQMWRLAAIQIGSCAKSPKGKKGVGMMRGSIRATASKDFPHLSILSAAPTAASVCVNAGVGSPGVIIYFSDKYLKSTHSVSMWNTGLAILNISSQSGLCGIFCSSRMALSSNNTYCSNGTGNQTSEWACFAVWTPPPPDNIIAMLCRELKTWAVCLFNFQVPSPTDEDYKCCTFRDWEHF